MQAKNPARDLPIALFTSLGVSSVVYILMACAITLMVPYKLIDLQAPFSVAFHTAHEPWLAQLVSIGAVIAIGTVLIVSLPPDHPFAYLVSACVPFATTPNSEGSCGASKLREAA